MGGVVKAVKKVVSGVGKAVKSVVKGVVKVAKKVVSAVGDAMGKLGPVGTIALSFIAPYAIGALAGSSIGWVSTIGKGLQAIGSTIAAPFKAISSAAGNLLGGAAKSLGTFASEAGLKTIGEGLMTISDKIYTGIGTGIGDGVSDAFTKTWNGVSEAWGAASDSFASTMNGTFEGPQQLPEDVGSLMPEGDQIFDPAKMTGADQVETTFMGSETTQAAGSDAFSQALDMQSQLTNAEGYYTPQYDDNLMGSLSAANAPASPEMIGYEGDPLQYGATEFKGYTAQDLANAPYDTSVESESTWDKLKDGLKSFGASDLPDTSGLLASNISTSGYEPLTSESAEGPGYSGQAQNFYMLDASGQVVQSTGQTGIMGSMEYARQAGSLLSTTGNPYKYRWA